MEGPSDLRTQNVVTIDLKKSLWDMYERRRRGADRVGLARKIGARGFLDCDESLKLNSEFDVVWKSHGNAVKAYSLGVEMNGSR